MIEKIERNNELYALIIRHDYCKQAKEGISFFTPNDFSQQLAYMRHPKGKIIQPHVHNPVPREVSYTQEVLFIKSGKLRVDFYDLQQYFESRLLVAGDVILLAKGGHGFEVIEAVEMFEVKQGPYLGEQDKTRFSPSEKEKIEES